MPAAHPAPPLRLPGILTHKTLFPHPVRMLYLTARSLTASGVDNAHDLTGRVFQRLIADRKYLATFYTRPASAALLARLAVSKLDDVDWADANAIGKLRIGDFACGTGALLSAVYEQIASHHERAGGDPADLHRMMMEEVMYGIDVMPSAVHITGATLAGVEASVAFYDSRLHTIPYGKDELGRFIIGSLEFLRASEVETNERVRGNRDGAENRVVAKIPDEGFDLIIMNPPFTSDTKHRDARAGVLNAAFAAFNAPKEDQKAMADRATRLAQGTCHHGHAGLGSTFAAIADKKLKPNGVMALILSLSAIKGSSWAKFRTLLESKYTDIEVISISGEASEISFSSDTHIAECLIVARKAKDNEEPSRIGRFTSIRERPKGLLEALEYAKGIGGGTKSRLLADGPYGAVPFYSGNDLSGEVLVVPLANPEGGWGAARLSDASVAQMAHSLTVGRLWLPGEQAATPVPVVRLQDIGRRGVDSQLLISAAHKGPFQRTSGSPTATYPAMWSHQATVETKLVC